MIIVYFEYMKTNYCEEVARFISYEAYDKCYDTLTKLAKDSNMILTDSVIEEKTNANI